MPSSYQFVLWKQESFLIPPAFFRNLLGWHTSMWAKPGDARQMKL
jgi:hypothetical protein